MSKKRFFILTCFCLLLLITSTTSYSHNYEFSKKDLKDIKTMEIRHFGKCFDKEDTTFRIQILEEEIFDSSYDTFDMADRIKRLKIGSQKKMLQGMSIPNSMKVSGKRIQNNRIQISDKDNVGIFDGLLKLYRPDIYEIWKRKQESINRYDEIYLSD